MMGLAQGVPLDGLAETLQPVVADRDRPVALEQSGEAPRHQQLVAARAAHRFDTAYKIDVGADDGEIEPPTGADIAVADLPIVEGDAGAELGIGLVKPMQR